MRSAVFVLLSLSVYASDPIPTPPEPNQLPKAVRLPAVEPERPKPVVQLRYKISSSQTLVIDSDVQLFVLTSPPGFLKIVEDAGPLSVRAEFVGVGSAGIETRKFAGKHVYSLTAKMTGTVEVLLIPSGVAKEADIVRIPVEVDAGAKSGPPAAAQLPSAAAADPELVAKLKAAIATDAKEYERWRGTTGPKTVAEAVTLQASVYVDATAILTTGDKALMPATWGNFLNRLTNLATDKEIPRLPALEQVRAVTFEYLGARKSGAVFDGETLDDLVKKLPVLAASLKEAAK